MLFACCELAPNLCYFIVLACSKVEGERFQDLLELDGLDVWAITPDGSADIRMKKELYRELKVVYPECSILHSSVEELVREAEREMRPKNLTADWFEEYVSLNGHANISPYLRIGCYSNSRYTSP